MEQLEQRQRHESAQYLLEAMSDAVRFGYRGKRKILTGKPKKLGSRDIVKTLELEFSDVQSSMKPPEKVKKDPQQDETYIITSICILFSLILNLHIDVLDKCKYFINKYINLHILDICRFPVDKVTKSKINLETIRTYGSF